MQTLWNNALSSDFLKTLLDIANGFVKAADSAGLFNTAIAAFLGYKTFRAKNNSIFDIFKIFEYSKDSGFGLNKNSAIGAIINGSLTNGFSGAAAAAKSFGVGTKLAAAGTTLLNAALTMGISLLAGFVFEKVISGIDNFIHRAENLKQEVEDLTNTYNDAKNVFSENLESLSASSDESKFKTLDEEFRYLAAGVDELGNNVSLTADEYSRYKEICDQIVGIHPGLAAGYDSSTQAINNNASALSNLIELQKLEARQNAQEYISDDNLKKIAESKINDYEDAVEEYEKWSGFQLYDKFLRNSGWGNGNQVKYGDKKANATDPEEYVLNKLGISNYDEMKKILSKYAESYNEKTDSYEDVNHIAFFTDYADKIADAAKEFPSALQDVINKYKSAKKAVESAQEGLVDSLLQVPASMEEYDGLSDGSKSFVTEWIKNNSAFKIDENTTKKQVLEYKAQIRDFINSISSGDYTTTTSSGTKITASDILDEIFSIDTSSVNWDKYKQQIQELVDMLWNAIGGENNTLGFKNKDALLITLGFNFEVSNDNEQQMVKRYAEIKGITEDDAKKYFDSLPATTVQRLIQVDWNTVDSNNVDDVVNGASAAGTILSVKTYSALSDDVDSFNEVQKQTSEIVADNTEVTQEYKDSLTELGISETDLAACFDDNNSLVVKNARLLNNLVKNSRSNVAQNVKLAKSQAMLKYRELYNQIKALTGGQKVTNQATLNQINSLYKEMGVLQKTITQYNMLEQELLGAANAYEKFTQAQEADSSTDYISSAEDMVLALGKAFNTAELGSETAKTSIAGLVPESVYQDLDTVDDKMAAIYDYFKNGKLSQYFTLEFDEDGSITSAEMKLGNLRKFIEDGMVDNNVFSGEDWQHFDFSDSFLAELDELPEKADKMQYFADKMGVTKEVAFAFIKSLEDHDIEWLKGDYSSLFDSLMPESLENDIYKNTSALSELEVKLANGEITAEEYQKSLYGLDGQLNSGTISQEEYNAAVADLDQKLANGTITSQQYTEAIKGLSGVQDENSQKARDNAVAWAEANDKVNEAKDKVETLTDELNKLKESGASEDEIQIKTDQLKVASAELSEALKQKYNLQEPTEVTIHAALDDIQEQMDQWKADNAELTVDILPKLVQDENGKWTIPADIEATLDENSKANIQKYINLLNDQHTITVLADDDPNDSTKELDNVKTAAEAAKKAVEDIPNPQIDTSSAISAINKLQTAINNIKGTTVDIYENTHKSTTYSYGTKANGTTSNPWNPWSWHFNGTSVNGTAHANGSWGAAKDETSLVGELGPELLVRDGRWTTIGENGAEFTDIKKGDIIFNHKQTESLFKNGYVTSRGKAYASGSLYNNGPFNNLGLDKAVEYTEKMCRQVASVFDKLKLDQLAKDAEEMCRQYEELVNGNVDLRNRPHLSPSYEHDLAMSGGYSSFIGSDGEIYASTSAETVTIGDEKNKYTIDITPVLENGEVLTSDSLDEYINNLVTDGSTQDLLDSDKYNLIIRAVPGEYDEKDWTGFEDELSKYKDGYLNTIIDMFNIGGEEAVGSYGFSSVGLSGVVKDLQNNGSYDGKEVASAIDSTSDGMRNLDDLINQYVTDVLNAKSLADDIGTDLSKTKYGNVDTDNRQILNWDEKSVDKYGDAIESWGMKVDDLVGSYSTLLSSTGEFDGTDIAFTPILQTENGPQLLDSSTVDKYINGLIDKASENGGQWTSEDLFKLDTEGLEIDGTIIKNLLEDIGDNASKTSQLLHYVGDTGSIANLEGEIESTSSELVATGENVNAVQAKLDKLNATNISDKTFTVSTVYQTIGSGLEETARTHGASGRYTKYANGTAHVNGNWGLQTNEHHALVGELGPELIVDPSTGKYYTVGDNGAEMVELKKGSIIFNHKQTEGLLKNGYVTSRGKMLGGNSYAEGNAHVTIWPNGSSKQQWNGTGYSGPSDSTYSISNSLSNAADSLSDAAEDLSDATDEFEEVFDWIEVRLQKIDETIDLLNAQLDNTVGYSAQNSIIDQLLGVSNTKMSNLQAGLQEYANYASKLLAEIPAQYQEAAQDGAIAITEFAGEADEATVDAINNYRDWADKVADLTKQIEELRTEIASLAKQKFDNVSNEYDNVIKLIEDATDKLDAQVDLMEDRGYVAAKQYYESMMENTKQQSAELQKEKVALQDVLDQQVKLGNIKVGSDSWYEMVDALYEVDAAIVDCTANLEEYQNAINDIYWDNFDELINRLDYLNNETENLIDLMGNADIVTKPEGRTYEGGTTKYWTADDVQWTDEGIASLGLYAQQMEIAEYKAKQYGQAIDDLNKDYADGKYSESEYLEKLNELTSAQYDSIESYYDAQDSIKKLNETRIDSIKDGIEKEIDAYSELIDKKKEELDAEKDLYDWQKTVSEGQKNIADIQRKLTALSTDQSASAIAKRKKLEQELAEAKADLEEQYYDRSISDRSDALDKEQEDFENSKNKEIEKWEEYLDNIEQVVADSLGIVQANASGVYDTLSAKAQEYNLTLSDAIMTPWKDGAFAVSDYQDTFDTAMSSTWDQLDSIKMKWQEIIDKMAEAAAMEIKAQQAQNNRYGSATYTPPEPAQPSQPAPAPAQKTISVGGQINAGSARIYSDSEGHGGGRQYYRNDPIYTVLKERNGYILVRHHSESSGYTGWFKKSDVTALAKGTKGLDKSGIVNVDELGEELVLRAQNGRLTYMEKGTGVIPADLTSNLMEWGQLDPRDMIEQNRPSVSVPSEIKNTEINLSISYGDMLHIEEFNGEDPDEIAKIVAKQFEKHTKDLNNALRRYSR